MKITCDTSLEEMLTLPTEEDRQKAYEERANLRFNALKRGEENMLVMTSEGAISYQEWEQRQ